MIATLKDVGSEWISAEGEKQFFRCLDKYERRARWLPGAKRGGGGSLEKNNSFRGESDIAGNSVGCSRVSTEHAHVGACFLRTGECPILWFHWPAGGTESMPAVRSSNPAPFTLPVRIPSIGLEKPCVPSVARE